jgi:predicted site-specific integrase-resolvase
MKHAALIYKKELCTELGISRSTLYRWMRDAGIVSKRGLITLEQADEIRKKIVSSKQGDEIERNETK